MKQVPLFFPFFIALFFSLFGTALFPQIKILSFSPFLALLYNRFPFQKALWIGAICGLIVDLLSSHFHFGLHSLCYSLTTLFLYKRKKHFFEDKPLALCIFTFLISACSSSLQLLLIAYFDQALPLSFALFLSDLFLMPCIDSCYAFFCFSCPMLLCAYIKKVGWRTIYLRLIKLFEINISKKSRNFADRQE